jgi:RNA exonuclease 1
MLPSLGLFKSLPCPLYPSCNRNPCFFSHTIQPPKPQQVKKPEREESTISKRKREEEILANKKARQQPDQAKKPSSSSTSRLAPISSTAKQAITEKKNKPVVQRDQFEPTNSKQRVAHKATVRIVSLFF